MFEHTIKPAAAPLVCAFLAAAAISFGTLTAAPVRAAVTINSVTGVPNPVPAAGAFSPVLITCGGTNGQIPTGDETLTNSITGQVASHNNVTFYQKDANGNPVVYAYVTFPVNHSPTQVSYRLVITVRGSDGKAVRRTMTLAQGILVPITINNITTDPAVLPAAGTTLGVNVSLTANGLNQAGFQSGYASVSDNLGNVLDLQAFQGTPVSDDQGGLIYAPYPLSHIPVNTTSLPRTFTINVGAKDSTGLFVYRNLDVMQSAASAPLAAATLTLDAASDAGAGNIAVTLTTDDGTPLGGKSVNFIVDGLVVGTGVTNDRGRTSHKFIAPVGIHQAKVLFAGDRDAGPASDSGDALGGS